MSEVTIWDGEEIRQVPDSEAKELIAKDMAQDMAKEDGLSLKYRKDFTGYKTRELRAETPPTPVVSVPADVQAREVDSPVDAGDEAASDWKDYKAQAKEALGLQRISQEKVEQWMSDEGIS